MVTGRDGGLRIMPGEAAGVFHFSGELDLASVGMIDGLESPEPQAASNVIFRFPPLTFMDSSGISALILAARRVADGHLVLSHPASEVRTILDMAQIAMLPGITIET